MQDMFFNAELPTDSVDVTIPVTAGCDVSFVVNQSAGNSDGQVPVNFESGDSVYLSIELSRSATSRIDATLDANTASFTIPADIAERMPHQMVHVPNREDRCRRAAKSARCGWL